MKIVKISLAQAFLIADILLGAVAFVCKGGKDLYKKQVAEATGFIWHI